MSKKRFRIKPLQLTRHILRFIHLAGLFLGCLVWDTVSVWASIPIFLFVLVAIIAYVTIQDATGENL